MSGNTVPYLVGVQVAGHAGLCVMNVQDPRLSRGGIVGIMGRAAE